MPMDTLLPLTARLRRRALPCCRSVPKRNGGRPGLAVQEHHSCHRLPRDRRATVGAELVAVRVVSTERGRVSGLAPTRTRWSAASLGSPPTDLQRAGRRAGAAGELPRRSPGALGPADGGRRVADGGAGVHSRARDGSARTICRAAGLPLSPRSSRISSCTAISRTCSSTRPGCWPSAPRSRGAPAPCASSSSSCSPGPPARCSISPSTAAR